VSAVDIDLTIRNATLQDLQQMFGHQQTIIAEPTTTRLAIAPQERKVIMASVPVEDHRDENLARSTIPGDELKSQGKKAATGKKWDIPFDSQTESAKYEAARKLCKKFGKPYSESLKLAEAAGVREERKAAPNKWQIPFSSKTQPHEYYLAWTLCRKYKLSYPEALIRQAEETTGVIVQKTAENVAKRSEDTYNDAATLHPEIATGMYVRQIKPYKGDLILGTAMVLSREGNLIEVRNGNKKKHTIDVECLELAESPGKQPAAEPVKSKKTSGHTVTCPYCEHSCNSHAMHLHVRNKHREKYEEYLDRKKDKIPAPSSVRASDDVPDIKTPSPREMMKKPFPSPSETGAAALPSEKPLTAVVPDEDPLDIHIEGVEGLDDDTLDTPAPDEEPPVQDDPEEQPSPADEPETGDIPPSPAPEQPGGLRRGQKVKHDGSKSDPHYGEIGTVERVPQNLQECLVRFRLSSSWINKDNLIPVEGGTACQ
jgi:hypothetical protein